MPFPLWEHTTLLSVKCPNRTSSPFTLKIVLCSFLLTTISSNNPKAENSILPLMDRSFICWAITSLPIFVIKPREWLRVPKFNVSKCPGSKCLANRILSFFFGSALAALKPIVSTLTNSLTWSLNIKKPFP